MQYKQSGTFYVLNGRYYWENPLRVNPDPSDIPYLRTISTEELKDRLTDLQESIAENNIVSKLKHFDRLIVENEDSPNIRAMLIETRLALTGIDDTSYLAKSDSLNSFLHLLEKSETSTLWVWETLALIWHWLNIARYYFPEKTWILLSWFKDVTSAKLFAYGKENAPWEQYMENLILKYNLADSPDDTMVELSKIPPAVLAWTLDGSLDFIQSNIELVIVPDKIIGGIVDLIPLISDNIWALWTELVEWIENESDVAYIISYAVSVIACLLYVNPWVWIFTIPALVIKPLAKFNLWSKALGILEANLTKNISKITTKIGNTVNLWKQWYGYTSKILERGRNITDSAGTWAKRMKWTSDELLASRQVLRKLNDTLILADIFWKNMDSFISKKENTDIALNVYEEEILKGNGIVLDNLEEMIQNSNGELQYNLLRIRERFDEMKDIFEREIFPVADKTLNHDISYIELQNIYNWFYKNRDNLNELTVSILEKYYLNKKD